mmetsp:Transcript_25073/g.59575  ORF Transcript_25073/g.59575 Transcript_25073/m.59575 type:complete len:202 (+) Transcript_25073:938-1543(+)
MPLRTSYRLMTGERSFAEKDDCTTASTGLVSGWLQCNRVGIRDERYNSSYIELHLQSSTPFEILTYLRSVLVEVPPNLLIELLVSLIDRRNVFGIKLDPALFVRSFLRAALHLAGETLRALLLGTRRSCRPSNRIGESRVVRVELASRLVPPGREMPNGFNVTIVVCMLTLGIIVVVDPERATLPSFGAGVHLTDAVERGL